MKKLNNNLLLISFLIRFLKYSTIIIIILFVIDAKSQTSCSSPHILSISVDPLTETFTANTTEYWTKINISQSELIVFITNSTFPQTATVTSFILYSGQCTNLTQLYQSVDNKIIANNLDPNLDYYIKFNIQQNNFGSFEVKFAPAYPQIYVNPNPICSGDVLTYTGNYISQSCPDYFKYQFDGLNIPDVIKTGPGKFGPFTVNIPTNTQKGNYTTRLCVSWDGVNWYCNIWPSSSGLSNHNEAILTVKELPDNSFTVSSPKCPGDPIWPDFNYSPDVVNIDWGDGNFSSPNFSHQYSSGTYTITAYANSNQCGTSPPISHTIEITIHPNFTANTECLNDGTNFTNTTDCTHRITSWQWNFGDGTSSNLTNPTHIYKKSGTYNVTLTATSLQSEIFKITKPVTVYPLPDVPIISGINNDCDGTDDVPYFIDNPITGATYTWSIVNGTGTFNNTSNTTVSATNLTNVTIDWTNIPATPNYAEIEVEVINSNGCSNKEYYKVFECCEGDPGLLHLNNTTLSSNQTYISIYVNGNLQVTSNVTLSGCNLFMGPMASITLDQNVEFKTTANTQMEAGCGYMWSGIYSSSSSSKITINNSEIYHMIDGVIGTSGTVMDISGSGFYDNYTSIQVKNADYSSNPQNLKITGCTLKTQKQSSSYSNSDYSLILPPFAGAQAKTGIYVENVNGITIGDPATNPNEYVRLLNGIITLNSNTTILNNGFDHINNISCVVFKVPPSAAIYSRTTNISLLIPAQIVIGESGSVFSNKFDYCDFGIYSYRNKSVIEKNLFENTIIYGIYLYEIINQSEVKFNKLENPGGSGAAVKGIGMKIANTTPRLTGIKVFNNEIKYLQSGIYFYNSYSYNNYKSVCVYNNNIYFSNSTTSKRYGFYIGNCDKILVQDNSVVRTMTNPLYPTLAERNTVIGLRINQSDGAQLHHNYFYKLGSGIYTNGNLINTFFYCNNFSNCYDGMFCGHGSAITNQGFPASSTYNGWNPHNKWMNTISEKIATLPGYINLPPTSQKIKYYYFSQSSPAYNIHYDPEIIFQLSSVYNDIESIANDNAGHSCVNNNVIQNILLDSDILTDEERDILLGEVLEGEEYQYLLDEYRLYEMDYLYEILNDDPGIITMSAPDDQDYQDFYLAYLNSASGELQEVDDLIEEDEFELAWEANEAIVTTEDILEYRKTVNKIYLETYCANNFDLDASTVSELMSIASLTPYEGGNAVFSARVMLGLNADDLGVSYRFKNPISNNSSQNVMIYPNPSNSNVTIEFTLESETYKANFELYDIIGKKVFSTVLTNKLSEINFKDLNSGIYIYKILNFNGMISKGKLILK